MFLSFKRTGKLSKCLKWFRTKKWHWFRSCIWTYNVIIPKEKKSTSLNSLHTNIGQTRVKNTFSPILSPNTYHSQRHTDRKRIQHATIL